MHAVILDAKEVRSAEVSGTKREISDYRVEDFIRSNRSILHLKIYPIFCIWLVENVNIRNAFIGTDLLIWA